MRGYVVSYVVTSATTIAALALDDLRLRIRARRERRERAAAVASALANEVIVDGVTLPRPDDDRWRARHKVILSSKLAGDTEHTLIELGPVKVSDEPNIYIENEYPLPRTPDTQNYCTAVWKAYRSRVARKAINATT
jgi:hypothetical protein